MKPNFIEFVCHPGGLVAIAIEHIASVFQHPNGSVAIVLDNSIGYEVQAENLEEVLNKIKVCLAQR